MKRHLLAFAAVLLLALPASADEGMWLLPLLEKMNIKTMQQMGCQLSAEDIYSINHSSLKDAVVVFGGGCTAEMISPEGLLVTNHHCGYGSIQRLSSVEHDYLTDGYWAMNRSEELPAEGLSVRFLESFSDVTKAIEKAVKKAGTKEMRDSLYKEECARLVKQAVGEDKFLRGYVSELYGGNAYYLVIEKIFKDVRFVGAPPSSIGKFGADTDNWVWPRHTCDFSMFRVYADKDNNPADYSPDNVPYHPRRFLTISLKGVEPGDFSMIIGNPGSTNRFMTAAELRERRDINAIGIEARGKRQEILLEDMLADPKVKIQYASKYSGSSNGWKKSIGMNETFGKLDVEQRRADEEKAFEEWVSKKKSRGEKYGDALSKINGAVASRAETYHNLHWFAETVANIELLSAVMMAERFAGTGQLRPRMESFYKDYSMPTDIKSTKAMLRLYRENVEPESQVAFCKTIDEKFGGDIDAYVDDIYERSLFTTQGKAWRALGFAEGSEKADKEQLVRNVQDDPAYELASSYTAAVNQLVADLDKYNISFNEGKKAYIAGTLEMRKGAAIYPDANFTMRLTYGQIKPYSPRDGVIYTDYTTLKGVMEKEDPDNWEFVVPEKLKELYKAGDFGRYARKDGQMPACFINTCDITGGNSGSPVLNAKGELTGLAFDGNWEAMSGDIIFEPDLQRCIAVDIRYVLFILDKFGGAGWLLDEMKIVE